MVKIIFLNWLKIDVDSIVNYFHQTFFLVVFSYNVLFAIHFFFNLSYLKLVFCLNKNPKIF